MSLQSKWFRGNTRLQQCLVSDPSHVQKGDQGEHVKLIQQALIRIDNASIDSSELAQGVYGRTTASAVLAYKNKRNIINRSYQTRADDIVGKMTIKSLDDEMQPLEAGASGELFAAGLRPILGRLT